MFYVNPFAMLVLSYIFIEYKLQYQSMGEINRIRRKVYDCCIFKDPKNLHVLNDVLSELTQVIVLHLD